MAQHDMVIDNASGASVRADLNNALQAAATTHSGPSRPATPYAMQQWVDTNTPSGGLNTLNLYDGADDIPLLYLDTATNKAFSLQGGVPQTVASAAALDLSAVYSRAVDVTGTTGVTAVTLAEGDWRIVRFTGRLTLAHGANLVLPGGANLQTAPGDFAVLQGYASGVVRCVAFTRAGVCTLSAHRNGSSQSIPASNPTRVAWTTAALDPQAALDTATHPGRVTPPVPGWYAVRGQVTMASMDAGNLVQLSLYRTGTRAKLTNLYVQGNTQSPTVEVAGLLQLNGTTDHLELFVEHNNGSAKSVLGAADASYLELHPLP